MLKHPPKTQHLIALILLVGAGLGVLRALTTPYWNNPEEPRHFERVRLTVENGFPIQPQTPDRDLQQAIRATFVLGHSRIGVSGPMLNARLQNEAGLTSPEDWQALRADLAEDPSYYPEILLGAPQYGEPPLYYLYSAVLQIPFLNAPILTQLMVARLSSVLLGVLTLGLAYLTMRELFPEREILHVAVPAVLAVMPNFMTEMSSVNNTAAGVVAYAFVLWAGVRAARHGLNVGRAAVLLTAIVLCALSKPTAWGGLLIGGLALVFAFRSRIADRALLAGAGAGLLVAFAIVSFQGPLGWYPVNLPSAPADAAEGRRSLLLRPEGLVWQTVSPSQTASLSGQTVTVGAWVRSPTGQQTVGLPTLWYAPPDEQLSLLGQPGLQVQADENWQFHSYQVGIPEDARCLSVRLVGSEFVTGAVEYDGIVVTPGTYPEEEPALSGVGGGTWGGDSFNNVVSNGSGERRWLLLRPWIVDLLPNQLADTGLNLNQRLATYQDLRTNIPLISQTVRFLFTTYWSRFAWTMPGLPTVPVAGLALLSAVSAAGLVRLTIRDWATWDAWQRRALILFVVGGAAVLALSMLRIDPPPPEFNCHRYQGRFLAASYYTSPGFVPLTALWVMGLLAWAPQSAPRTTRWIVVALVLGLFLLGVLSLLNRQIPFIVLFYGLESDPGLWSVPRAWGP